MKVKVAKTAGFCTGVRRATNMALELSKSNEGPIYTYGPLVHNEQAVQMLRSKGVLDLDSLEGREEGTVIIRAHGVPPAEREAMEKQGLEVADATCPNIIASRNLIQRYLDKGYSIVLVGDDGHPEMLGLLGYTDGHGVLITSQEDARTLPPMDKICVIAQTTFNPEKYDQIAEILKQKTSDCKVFQTICNATQERQEEVLSLAQECDAMVVVGGLGSANTKRLHEIALGTEKPSFWVQTAEDLDMQALKRFETIGVTAGASTPNWVIRSVVEALSHSEFSLLPTTDPLGKYLWNTCIDSHMFLGLGAASLTYACAILGNHSVGLKALLVAFCYVLGAHVIHRLNERADDVFDDPKRAEFFEQNATFLNALGWCSALLALVLSFGMGFWSFLLVLICTIGGLLYRAPLFPIDSKRKRPLSDIPGSKDMALSVAWACVTCLVPALAHGGMLTGATMVAFLFAFTMMFTRSNLFDIKEIQGDKIVGTEMLPVLLGKRRTKALLVLVTFCQGTLLLMSLAMDWASPFAGWLFLTVAYACGYLWLYHKRVFPPRILCGLIADANFVLAGLLALLWKTTGPSL